MIEHPTALVTGASRGIGRAIALELAHQGYAIAVNYVRSQESADRVVQQIAAAGGHAIAVQGNVGLREDRDSIVDKTLETFGRIDLLVNNAGITSPGRKDLLEATEENWDVVFDTNLKGAFFLAQRVANKMVALISAGSIGRGTIV
ncbi:MAG TPA: SDR family NAD(P)-dependent oxidoreductase, partial [Pirellulaceae bacterium]|nr:SDR family NAD(P)-dependent oxidoreductase [Pirellulaceae bacterium]